MSGHAPHLDDKGQAALESHLYDSVAGRQVPATWLGVTAADKEIYFGYEGERVFGQPEEGMVDEHTGERSSVTRAQPLCSSPGGVDTFRKAVAKLILVLQLFSTTKFVTAVSSIFYLSLILFTKTALYHTILRAETRSPHYS